MSEQATTTYSENALVHMDSAALVDIAGVDAKDSKGRAFPKRALIAVILWQQGTAAGRHLVVLGRNPELKAQAQAASTEPEQGDEPAEQATVEQDEDTQGYTVRWPHGGYDLLKRDAGTEGPKWLVRCNLHGTVKGVESAGDGDKQGNRTARVEWCTGCATQAAAA